MRLLHSAWSWFRWISLLLLAVAVNALTGTDTRLSFKKPFQLERAAIATPEYHGRPSWYVEKFDEPGSRNGTGRCIRGAHNLPGILLRTQAADVAIHGITMIQLLSVPKITKMLRIVPNNKGSIQLRGRLRSCHAHAGCGRHGRAWP